MNSPKISGSSYNYGNDDQAEFLCVVSRECSTSQGLRGNDRAQVRSPPCRSNLKEFMIKNGRDRDLRDPSDRVVLKELFVSAAHSTKSVSNVKNG